MRVDDAAAKRIVEGLQLEFVEKVSGVGGAHGATFALGAPAGKAGRLSLTAVHRDP
jgi:hypothetical protein